MLGKKELNMFLNQNRLLSSVIKRVRPYQYESNSKEGTMFDKKEQDSAPLKKADEGHPAETAVKKAPQRTNAILKGSKLVGNITISHDLELTGDVEGNITSEEDSNIVIKGTCKGSIKTRGGSVEIEGEMNDGDIVAGDYVRITGKFNGGKVEAGERIYINGEFSGTMESKEIEVGSAAQGKGELYYKEYVSIQRGANIEGQIIKVQEQKREAKRPSCMKVVELEQPATKKGEINS
jgi:cytoskeletal protein CcmA (bactofilin family)